MKVGELMEILGTIDPEKNIHTWGGFNDCETEDVYVSDSTIRDDAVLICDCQFGEAL